jgi:hypothetical protein
MHRDLDLFETYRLLLLIVCTVYTIVVMAQWAWRWLGYFTESRRKQVLGHYAVVLLLRARFRRFAGDLLEVAMLAAVLGLILYAHRGLAQVM